MVFWNFKSVWFKFVPFFQFRLLLFSQLTQKPLLPTNLHLPNPKIRRRKIPVQSSKSISRAHWQYSQRDSDLTFILKITVNNFKQRTITTSRNNTVVMTKIGFPDNFYRMFGTFCKSSIEINIFLFKIFLNLLENFFSPPMTCIRINKVYPSALKCRQRLRRRLRLKKIKTIFILNSNLLNSLAYNLS